jgi:NTE family protein
MHQEESGRRSALGGLPRPVALVVGGGGCLGAAHVGVGATLEDHGFVPDLVVGTSVGALNGAIVAAHPGSAAPWLSDVWTHVRRSQVLPLRAPWRTGQAGGVFSRDGLRRLIAQAGLPARLEELPVPFTAVATDVVTGRAATLQGGPLESAVLASAAIPGLLPPVERDGQLLVDGGVIAYVPVTAALAAGAASMVVLSSGPESWPMRPTVPRRRAPSIASRSALLMLHHQIERDLEEVSRHVPTVVLPTGIEDWPQPWDFGQSERLISTARAASLHFLDGMGTPTGPGLYRAPAFPDRTGAARATDTRASALAERGGQG